jgi:hypothetical protein
MFAMRWFDEATIHPIVEGLGFPAESNKKASEEEELFLSLFAFYVSEHGPREGPYKDCEYSLKGKHGYI